MHFRDTLDDEAKEREWKVDRIAWGLIALVVAASANGLLGDGPLARETVGREADGASYTLGYQDINRRDHMSTMTVAVDAPAAEGGTLQVALSPGLASALRVRSTVPDADGGGMGPEGAVYMFEVEDWSAPVRVTFEYMPDRLGRTSGEVAVTAGGGAPVRLPFAHYVLP